MAGNNFKYIINTQLNLDGGSLNSLISELKSQDEEIRRLIEGMSQHKISFDTSEATGKIAQLSSDLENIKRNSNIEFKVSETGLNNLNSIKRTLTDINNEIARLSQEHEINLRPSSVGSHLDNEISNYEGTVRITRVEFTSQALDSIREQIEGQKYRITAEIVPDKKIMSSDIVDWSDLNTVRPNQQNQGVTVDGSGEDRQGRFTPNEIRDRNQGHNFNRVPHFNFEQRRNRNENSSNNGRILNRNGNPTNNPNIMQGGLPASLLRRWYEDDTKYIEQNLGQQRNRPQQTDFSNLNQGSSRRRLTARRPQTQYSSQPNLPTFSDVDRESGRQRSSYVKRTQRGQNANLQLGMRNLSVGARQQQFEQDLMSNIYKKLTGVGKQSQSTNYQQLSPDEVSFLKSELKRAKTSMSDGKSKIVDKVSNPNGPRVYATPKQYAYNIGNKLRNNTVAQKQQKQLVEKAQSEYQQFVESQRANPNYDAWLKNNTINPAKPQSISSIISQQTGEFRQEATRQANSRMVAERQVSQGTNTITPNVAKVRGMRRVGNYGYFPTEDKVILNPNSSVSDQHKALQDNLKAYQDYAKQVGQLDPTFKGFSKTFSVNFKDADGTLHQIQSLTYNIDQFGKATQRGAKSFGEMVSMMAEKTFIYGTLGTMFYQIADGIGEAVKNMSEFQQQMIRFQTFTQGNDIYSAFNQQQTTDAVFGMASQYGVSATNAVMPAYQDVIRRQDLIGVVASGNTLMPNQVVTNNSNIKADPTIANNLTEKALQMGIVSYGPALDNEETQKVQEDLLSVYSNTYNGVNPATGKKYTPQGKMNAFNQYMDTIASFEKYGGDASKTLDVVGELAPETNNMGIDPKTLAGLASAYTLKNTDASAGTISTTLKTFFSAIERPTNSDTMSALQSLGINPLNGTNGAPMNPEQIIQEIFKKYPNASNSTRAMVAMKLSSLSGGRSSQRQATMQQLLDSSDLKVVQDQFLNPNGSAWNSQGTAKQMAQARMDSLHGQWTQLDEKMDQFIVALGNGGVLGALTGLLKGLNLLMSAVNGVTSAFGRVGTFIDHATGGIVNPAQSMGQVATGMAVYGAGRFAWNKLGTGRQQRIKGFIADGMASNPNVRLKAYQEGLQGEAFKNTIHNQQGMASDLSTRRLVQASVENGAISTTPYVDAEEQRLQRNATRYNRVRNFAPVSAIGDTVGGATRGTGSLLGRLAGFIGISGRSMRDSEGNVLSRGARATAVGSRVAEVASTGMAKFGSTIVETVASMGPMLIQFVALTAVIGLAVAAFKGITWLFTQAQNKKNAEAKQQSDTLYATETSLAQSSNAGSALKAYNVTGVNQWLKLNDKQTSGKRLSASEKKQLAELNNKYGKVGMSALGKQTETIDMGDGMYTDVTTGSNQYTFIKNGHKVTGNASQLKRAMSFGASNDAQINVAESQFNKDFSKVGLLNVSGGGYIYQAIQGESTQLLNQMQESQNAYQTKMAQNQVKFVGSDTQAGALQANISATQQYLSNTKDNMATLTQKGNFLDSSSSKLQADLKVSGSKLSKKIGKKGVSDLQTEFNAQMQANGNVDDLMKQYQDDSARSGYINQMQEQYQYQQAQLSNAQSINQAKQQQAQYNAQLEQMNAQLALAKTGVQAYQQAITELNNTIAQGQAMQSSATTYQGQLQGAKLTQSGYVGQLSQYQQMASSLQSAMEKLQSQNPNQDFSVATLYGSASNGLSQAQQDYKGMLDSYNQAQQGISSSTQAISSQNQEMISLIMNTKQYYAMWQEVQQSIQLAKDTQVSLAETPYQRSAMVATANLQSNLQGGAFNKGAYLQQQYQSAYQSDLSTYSQLQSAIKEYGGNSKELQDAMSKINQNTTQTIVDQVVNPLKDLVNTDFKNSTDSFKSSNTTFKNTVGDFQNAVNSINTGSGSGSKSGGGSHTVTTYVNPVSQMTNTQILDNYMKMKYGDSTSSKKFGPDVQALQKQFNMNLNAMFSYMKSQLSQDPVYAPYTQTKTVSNSSSNSSTSGTSNGATDKSLGGGSFSPKTFVQAMQPYAEQASQMTGVPVGTILTQWYNESGYGNSGLTTKANNFAGIKSTTTVKDGSISMGGNSYASYNNIEDFVKGYAHVMNLSYYSKVRSAGSVESANMALANSPWAESGYAGGKNLDNLYNRDIAPYLSNNVKSATGSGSSSNGTANNTDPVLQASQAEAQMLLEAIQEATQGVSDLTNSLVNNGIAGNLATGIRSSNFQSIYGKDPFTGITTKYNAYQQAGEQVGEQQYQVEQALTSYQMQAKSISADMGHTVKGSDQWNAYASELSTLNNGITQLKSTLSDLNKTAQQYLNDENQDPRLNSTTASSYIVGGNQMINSDKTGSVDYYNEMNAVNQYYQNFMTTAKKTQTLQQYWGNTGQQTTQYEYENGMNNQNNINILYSQLSGLNTLFGKLASGTEAYYSTLTDLAQAEQKLHDIEQQKLQDDQTLYNLTGKGLSQYTQQMAYTQTKDYNQAVSNEKQAISQAKSGQFSGGAYYNQSFTTKSSTTAKSIAHDMYSQYGVNGKTVKNSDGTYTVSTANGVQGSTLNGVKSIGSNQYTAQIGKLGYSSTNAKRMQSELSSMGISSSLHKLSNGDYTISTTTPTSSSKLDSSFKTLQNDNMTEQIGSSKGGYSKTHAETIQSQLKKKGISSSLHKNKDGLYVVQTTTDATVSQLNSVNSGIKKSDSYVKDISMASRVGYMSKNSNVTSSSTKQTSSGQMDESQLLASYQIISENSQKMTDQMNTYRDAVTGAFQAGSMSVQEYIKNLNNLRDTQKEAKTNATDFIGGMQGDFQNNFASAIQQGMNGGINSPAQFMDSMKQSFAQEISSQMSTSLINNSGLQNVMNGLITQVGSVIASGNPTQIANMFSGNSLGDQFNSALQPFLPLINQIVESTKGILTTITDQNFNSPNGFKVDPYLYASTSGLSSSQISGGPTATYTNGTNNNGVGSPMGDGTGSNSSSSGGVSVPSGNSTPTGAPTSTSSNGSTSSTGSAEGTSGSGSTKTSTSATSGSSSATTTKAPSKGVTVTSGAPKKTSSSSSSSSTYTVKSGDTLSGIGAKLHEDWHTIASLNGIKSPYRIYVGEHLKVKGSSSSSSSSSSSHTYTVQKGDNPWTIENKLHLAHGDLQKKNPSMNPNKLQIGEKLKYHTGGFVGVQNFSSANGLQPNEISAIFQKGETALQPKQLSDLIGTAFNGGVASSGSNVQHNTTVHVNIPAGSGLDQKSIEGVVQTAVSEAMTQMQKSTRRSNLMWNGTPR